MRDDQTAIEAGSEPRVSLRSVGSLVSWTVVGQAVSLGAIALLSYLIGPALLGRLALITVAFGAVAALSALRYETAIAIAPTEQQAAEIARGCLALSAVVALVVLGISLLVTDPSIAFIMAFGVIAVAWQELNAVALTRSADFKLLSRLQVAGTAGPIVAQTLLALVGVRSLSGLLAVFVTTRLLVTLAGLKAVELHRASVTVREVVAALAEFKVYPVTHLPYALLAMANNRATIFVVAAFASDTELGYYTLAWRLTSGLVTLPSAPLRRVVLSCANQPRAELQRIVHLYFRIVGLAILPGFLLVMFISNDLSNALGGRWQGLGIFLVAGAVDGFGLVATSWQDRIYDVIGRQARAVVTELVGVVWALAVLIAALALTSTGWALLAYAVADLAYNMVWLPLTWRLAKLETKPLAEVGLFVLAVTVAHGALALLSGNSAVWLLSDLSGWAAVGSQVAVTVLAVAVALVKLRPVIMGQLD